MSSSHFVNCNGFVQQVTSFHKCGFSTENLPAFINTILDDTYNYHTHQLKCEPIKDGGAEKYAYKYTVLVSKRPISNDAATMSDFTETTTVSDSDNASTVTYTERDLNTLNSSLAVNKKIIENRENCVMMVNIKFLLFYTDLFGKEAQHTFQQECSTDETLRDVISEFENRYRAKTKQIKFNPRLSLCIGEVTRKNSRPIDESHLGMTIAELCKDSVIGRITLVADLINKF